MERVLSPEKRLITSVLATFAALAIVAFVAYFVVHVRAAEGGALQPMATVSLPSPAPGTRATEAPAAKWLVAKTSGTVIVYRQPSSSALVRATLSKLNPHGYPTLMLVRKTRQIDGLTWYNVWLAMRPNGSSGWVQASDVGTYATVARIVIDVSARRLSVYRGGRLMGRFPVAVGSSAYPTPTGSFFIDEKFRPSPSGGLYGVLAMGLSAFQPRLPTLGSLAIHGTNNDACIGRAISDGCIRMHNADVLKVSAWVPSGSPVVIER
jgi:lipoprotein-anchoring transpeptidase ErfK/SrfK